MKIQERKPAGDLSSAAAWTFLLLAAGFYFALKFKIYSFLGGPLPADGESAERIFWAWEWLRHPSFSPSPNWLPLPFWITGAAFFAFPSPLLVPDIISNVLGLFSLWLVFRISSLLFPGERLRPLLAAAAAAFSLHHVLESMYPSSDPFFWCAVLGGTFLSLRWLESGDERNYRGALASFAAGSLVRYEGWIFCLAFYGLSAARGKKAAGLAVFSGPALWLSWQWAALGDPFHFLKANAASNFAHRVAMPNWHNLRTMLGAFFLALPFAGWGAALAPAGRLTAGLRRTYFLFAFLPLGVFAVLSFLGNLPAINRHIVVFQMLLSPLWAAAAALLIEKRSRAAKAIYLLLLLPLLALGVHTEWDEFRRVAPFFQRTGRQLADCIGQWTVNFSGEDSFLFEVPDGELPGLTTRANFPRVWRAAAMPFTSYFDRDLKYRFNPAGEIFLDTQDNPSPLELPPAELEKWLSSRRVRMAVIQNAPGHRAFAAWTEAGRLGPYSVYTRRDDSISLSVPGCVKPSRRRAPGPMP